ncbi:hypothetical protein O1L55_30130 [Streptomyces albulus]|nr:hypothetical protein [Streptomyces noursei]
MAEDYRQRAAHATALSTQLRTSGPAPMNVLAQRVIMAQDLSHTALADVLSLARSGAARTEDGLEALVCLARASQYAQDAAAALGSSMAQSLDDLRRSRSTPALRSSPSARHRTSFGKQPPPCSITPPSSTPRRPRCRQHPRNRSRSRGPPPRRPRALPPVAGDLTP